MTIADFFERPTRRFSCRICGWEGLGAELAQGELFSEIIEFDCPTCHERVTFVAFPTHDEVRDAAEAGVQDAIAMLDGVKRREDRWRRLEETRAVPIAEPADLGAGDVRCVLHLDDDDDKETWLVLIANEIELHRELAVWESTEPARRLLTVIRDRYGDRLVRFDYRPALLYLGGDTIGAIGELEHLVADLPESSS